LKNGQLTEEELAQFVEDSKELYEKAIVLRYKAYEEKVFGTSNGYTQAMWRKYPKVEITLFIKFSKTKLFSSEETMVKYMRITIPVRIEVQQFA
jgi:hypothetical protein